MKIIRSIDKESHERAAGLTLSLLRCEISSRTGLNKRNVANPFYTEDFDNGLIVCEYYQQADMGEKTWHGITTDLETDTVFCFDAATLAAVRLQCVRVVKNRFEANESKGEREMTVKFTEFEKINNNLYRYGCSMYRLFACGITPNECWLINPEMRELLDINAATGDDIYGTDCFFLETGTVPKGLAFARKPIPRN